MEKITKKQVKQIREGNHAVLMECLDFLLDSYEEDKWDLGYKACLSDLSVRSQKLAEYIIEHTIIGSKKAQKDDFSLTVVGDLAKVIEDYYTNALKNK